ncbi:MAG: threonine synthase [Acidobacteriota bacterium]
MQYFSTNRKSAPVSFREAILNGQPDDRGLYFPSSVPHITELFLQELHERLQPQITFDLMWPYVGGGIPDDILYKICTSISFDSPLVAITDRISALELFHGPTLAFKDVGACFMSGCLQYFAKDRREKTLVIVATSGDTGGAVAAGFHDVDGVEVVILYPKGKVSRIQELQLTTLGGNVTALEMNGNFDDCQALAKTALADVDLNNAAHITSANSINVARWLPQQLYYFFAYAQLRGGDPPIFSVPSGNFGNLAAGLLAQASGLPVSKFIAACNANDAVPEFMLTGKYRPKPSVATLSNAMDVGDPSNFVRILEIFGNDTDRLKQTVEAASISDETTAATMRDVYSRTRYILDPHGAVAFRALAEHLENHPTERGIFLETAHPIKFDSVETILGENIEPPASVLDLLNKTKVSIEMDVNYNDLKDLLLAKI